MQDNAAIRQAFRTRLFAQVAGASAKFLPENRDVAIPQIDPNELQGYYIAENFIPTREALVSVGMIEGLGRLTYHVVIRKGRGTEAAEAASKLIAEAFKPGTDVPVSSAYAHVDRSERGGAVDWHDAFFSYPVSISWRFYSIE